MSSHNVEDDEDYDYQTRNFYFQQRRGALDIRSLARLDLEKLVNEVDVDTLQSLLENVTFCNLRENDLKYLTDPLFLKLFHICQLIIEYLLFAQERLLKNVTKLAKKYSSKKRELLRKRKELAVAQETTERLENQVKLKREAISSLQGMLKEATLKHSRKTSTKKVAKADRKNDDVLLAIVTQQEKLIDSVGALATNIKLQVEEVNIAVRQQDIAPVPAVDKTSFVTERASQTEMIANVERAQTKTIDKSDHLLILMTERYRSLLLNFHFIFEILSIIRWNKLETSLRGKFEEQLENQQIKLKVRS